MVFEELFKSDFLERRPWYTFIIGFCCTIIATGFALLIFGSNPGYMAVAFLAILIIPTLSRLLQSYEKRAIREKKFQLWQLIKDHWDVFEVYLFLFMGVFSAVLLIALALPSGALEKLFNPQLAVAGITGRAFDAGFFWDVLSNNLLVFFVCLVLSLAYGAGSFLFLAWNATVWGSIFGYFMKSDLSLIIPALPHLFTETAAYLGAAIAGGILSKALLTEELFSKRFNHILTDSVIFVIFFLIILVAAAALEASIGLV